MSAFTICPQCDIRKSVDDFYENSRLCKECIKTRARKRQEKLRNTDPEWVEKERTRGREKYHRLNYKDKDVSPEVRKKRTKNYQEKFPEKRKAVVSVQRMAKEKDHKHHWSYNEEHFKSIIHLTTNEHTLLHRYMIYDQERKMYRNLKGVLLDSKESHLDLLVQLQAL